MTRKELKLAAKAQLGNQIFGTPWMLALLVCALTTIIVSAAAGIIPALGATLIIGPLSYGCDALFLRQARDGTPMEVEHLFDGFRDFGSLFILGFLQSLFVALWSLLLVVPGIVKAYAYAMSYYIKLDHPEYDWRQCLDESSRMMKGHKGELFMLDLSFIGWYIVGSLCLGVGTLWVAPYQAAARAQFYKALYETPDII